MSNYRAYAKVNIFLKITGLRGNYHEILSRFSKVTNLYDTISLKQNMVGKFHISGKFSCGLEENSIYRAYVALLAYSNKPNIISSFYKENQIHVEKNIPAFGGLGGGSSDAATFLRMSNEILKLGLKSEELAHIGSKVGADVPFFIYDYNSANVSGIGEIVNYFEEEPMEFNISTPDIECDTSLVYRLFREKFFKTATHEQQLKLMPMSSREVVKQLSAEEANDLFEPAQELCKSLKSAQPKDWLFSGSGSTFFKALQ